MLNWMLRVSGYMLLFGFAVFSVTPAHADFSGVRWVDSAVGRQLPSGAIQGGTEQSGYNNGMPLYVCRAAYSGSYHPGKLVSGKCNISYGGREIEAQTYQVAVGSGSWSRPKQGYVGALIGGQEPGRTLYVCRVNFIEAGTGIRHGYHPGKVVDGRCNFGFGGKELGNTTFELFYPRNANVASQVSQTSRHETRSELLIKNDTNSQISFFITTQGSGRLHFTWKPGLSSHPSKGQTRLMASGKDIIEIADWGRAKIEDVGIFNNGEWLINLGHAYKIMH